MTKRWMLLACFFFATVAAAKVNVVTTTTDLASIATYIGGDRVHVTHLATGKENPHTLEARPSFMVKAQKADLFVVVGLDLELWAYQVIDGSRNPKIRPGAAGYVDASRGCEILERPSGKVTRASGDVHPQGNPHYWLDPDNAVIMARNIRDGLKRVDPGGASVYDKNYAAFKQKIASKKKSWLAKMKPYRGTKVVSYHKTWPNFGKALGLWFVGYIEPKPGIPPSGAHIAKLTALMKQEGVKLILIEPFYSRKAAHQLAQKTGAKVVVIPPSVKGAKGVDDYFRLLDYNIEQVVAALR